MPQTSRFDDAKIETIMDDMLTVLEQHQANKDLSLIVLGNLVSHVFNNNVPKTHRLALADTFSAALRKSIEN